MPRNIEAYDLLISYSSDVSRYLDVMEKEILRFNNFFGRFNYIIRGNMELYFNNLVRGEEFKKKYKVNNILWVDDRPVNFEICKFDKCCWFSWYVWAFIVV